MRRGTPDGVPPSETPNTEQAPHSGIRAVLAAVLRFLNIGEPKSKGAQSSPAAKVKPPEKEREPKENSPKLPQFFRELIPAASSFFKQPKQVVRLISSIGLVVVIAVAIRGQSTFMHSFAIIALAALVLTNVPTARRATASRLRPITEGALNRTSFGRYQDAPTGGFNRWLWQFTDQRWNLGPHLWQRMSLAGEAIKERVDYTCFIIATVVIGGGQTKSGTSCAVAQQFSSEFSGHTLLLDMDPSGVQHKRTGVSRDSIQVVKDGHANEACYTARETYENRHLIQTDTDVHTHLAKMPGTELYVVVAGDNPLNESEYREFVDHYSQFFRLMIVDCSPDFESSDSIKAVVKSAHALAVPVEHRSEIRIEQAAKFIRTILTEDAYAHLRDRIVLVVSKVIWNPLNKGTAKTVELLQKELREHHLVFTGPVAAQPWNKRVKTKKDFSVAKRSWWFRLHTRITTAKLITLARQTPPMRRLGMRNSATHLNPTHTSSDEHKFVA